MNKLIMVVEDKSGKLFENLHEANGSVETKKMNYSEAKQSLQGDSPQAVIFNLDHQKDQVKEILTSFHEKHPNTYWALSTEELSTEGLVDFMRLGIRDFIKQPLNPAESKNLLQRIDDWQNKRVSQEHRDVHEVISVFSCKGGVGVSLIATNVARALAKRNLGRTLVADLVFQHGNIAEFFDLVPAYTIFELVQNLERLDQKLLESALQKHRSGVFVLPCPRQVEQSEFFATKDMGQMVKTLKSAFHTSVFDVGHELNATTLSCLDASDHILLVTTPDLASLCGAKVALQTFKKMGYSDGKVKLILNRWHMKGEIDCATIEKNLSSTIYHKLVDDSPLALNSINKGIPFEDLSKGAELAKNFDKLVEQLLTPEAKKNEA